MAPPRGQIRANPVPEAAPEPSPVADPASAAPSLLRPALERPLGAPAARRRDTRTSSVAPEVALVAGALDGAPGAPYAEVPSLPERHVIPVTDPI